MDRRAIQLPSQFFTGAAIGTNSPNAEMVIYAGISWLNAEVHNRRNFRQLEGPVVTVKTDDERNSAVDFREKCPVGLTVAIEIAGDKEVLRPFVLAGEPLRHPI